MSASLKEKDTGLKKFFEVTKALKGDMSVHIGVLGKNESRDGGATNADIAAFQEFGTKDIPERSFMRSTLDQNRPRYMGEMGRLLLQIVNGKMTVSRALNIMGAHVATDIKKAVTTGDPIPPPNAPKVAARKQRLGRGTIRTLVDTGRMIASITWEVVGGSNE